MTTDQQLPLLYGRYKDSQAVWHWGGREPRHAAADADLPRVFEPTFVRRAAASLVTTRPPVNPTFHLTAKPQLRGLSEAERARLTTMDVLGVRQLQFTPSESALSDDARHALEESVIPVLRSTVGTYLRIEGSAGWPAGAGLSESAVNALAFERARAVQDFIVKFGIPADRLILGTTLPRCRQCSDAAQVQRDNSAALSLATG